MSVGEKIPFTRDENVMVVVTFLALMVFCYFSGLPLIIPLLVFFFGVHLFYYKKVKPRLFLHLILLLALLVFAAQALKSYTHLNHFYLPIASIAMLSMLLFNDVQISFMMAFMSAVLAGNVFGFDLNEMIIFFLGGLAGAYKVKDAHTRGVLIGAGILVSLIQVISALLINPVVNKDILTYILFPLAWNGLLCAGVVLVTSKVFEMVFGEITNFTLLELSGSANPLLKRMVLEAPGSYHHSLIVSNLSESAAEAIGAHSFWSGWAPIIMI